MDQDTFDNTIRQLENKVGQITGSSGTGTFTSNKRGFLQEMLSNRKLIYALVPVLVFILLCFFKPKVVLEEVTDEDGNIEEKLSVKRAMIATVFLTSLAAVGVYYFKQRKNT